MMLVSTVNCSIGNKKKHFILTGLKELFYKDKITNIYEKYALKIIKNEALDFELEDFIQYYKISLKRVEKVLALL